jgi:ketosteroid isomerase-like protein
VVLGSPGLGKSRLLAELGRRLGERATLLVAQCQATGGASFAPLAEALRAQLGIGEGAGGEALRAAIDAIVPGEEAERARIAQGIGALLAGTPASPEETFFVVRRLLAALAAERPLVLAIDDLHWAEPLLLDLTEHLVQWGAGVPLLVLAAARPELRDVRSALVVPGGVVADAVTLAGLDANEATRLAASVIGAEALPAAVAGRVLATSEGNPLFVGELVRMLVQDGALRREGDRWTTAVELASLEMPPTIQALLAARIERLRPQDRLVLERASVVGRHFSRAALAQLLPGEARADLDGRLEALRRSELVEPDTGWLLGEPVLRFHHLLIRDAAYRRVLKETRAELHERLADWMAARAGDSVEHDETIGWHLEQAHQNLRELGALDGKGRGLGERAARYLAAAGRRALARDDLLPAASLLGRALDRLDAGDPARADLSLDWCEALLSAGDVATATRAIAELGRFIADSDRLRAWHTCFTGQLAVLTDPKALRTSAGAVAAAAETLTAAGDGVGEAKAHAIHALVLAQLGQIGACEAALDKALAAARRSHDRRRANVVLAGAPVAALWGPSPVTRASGRCLDVVRVLRITQGAPAVEAVALRCQAVLETLRGRGEAARRMIASSRKLVEELGITQRVLEADTFAGLIELLEGDAEAAERWLRSAWDGLREHGLGIDAAQAGALLARALLAQGRVAEAEAVSEESELLAGDLFKAAIAWRGVRAEVLAARGEHATAIEVASKAVEIAAATDDLLDHADARASLAVALRAAGRGAEADAEERRAIELWEAKGATLLVERARRAPTAALRVERAPLAAVVSPQATRPRVQQNHATRHAARLDEAVAAGDLQAVASLIAGVRVVDHVNGQTFGPDTILERFRGTIERSSEMVFRQEPIAVLGPSLALFRWREAGSEAYLGELPVGSYEIVGTVIIEADAEARALCVESFAPDRLGDAVVRLYERQAELLPEGPERERAAAIARSLAVMLKEYGSDRFFSAFAPAIESVDHRTLGMFSAQGADGVREAFDSWAYVAADISARIDEILALENAALVLRWTFSGTVRLSGGAFERPFIVLLVFGPDGLLTRWEQFDLDREAEALARFDELAAGAAPAARPTRRRVRPNDATRHMALLDAAVAARDLPTVQRLLGDSEVLHHDVAGHSYRPHELFRFIIERYADLVLVNEPIATLGPSLALARWREAGSALVGGDLPIGPFDLEGSVLIEADSEARAVHGEVFAADHLGDAIVRLYERHAELLPEGPVRTRAAATARSVSAYWGPLDLERFAAAWAPDVEFVDRRMIGVGTARGREGVLHVVRSLVEAAPDTANRFDDVLAVEPTAFLARLMNSGTDRTTGGAYERPHLTLVLFGPDGLSMRIEQFDADREAEALARFDELTSAQPRPAARRRVRPNAALANAARLDAVIAAGDVDGVALRVVEDFEFVDHVMGASYGRSEYLDSYRRQFRNQHLSRRFETLASLGDSLVLSRTRWSASGTGSRTFDIGSWELDRISLGQVDAQGKLWRTESFAAHKLADAIARIYERHAELLPEGPERTRAAAIARTVAELMSRELPVGDRYIATYAPDAEFADHRALVALPPARGPDEMRRRIGLWYGAVENSDISFDDVLDLRVEGLLLRQHERGRDQASGGSFEARRLVLYVFDAGGLQRHVEFFDADRHADALARFDELSRETAAPPRFANAATRTIARFVAAVEAHDWATVAACYAPESRHVDRRRLLQVELDRDQNLGWLRDAFGRNFRVRAELLATRGDRLALVRGRALESDELVGPSENEFLAIFEVNERGENVREVFLDNDDLDAAYAELDARYVAGEGAPQATVLANLRAYVQAAAARDDDAIRSALPADLTFTSHRQLLKYERVSRDEWLASIRNLGELGDLVLHTRVEHIPRLSATAGMLVLCNHGTVGGGSFETRMALVFTHDGRRPHAVEEYDLEQLDAAFARYEELSREAHTPPRIENAATRAMDAFVRSWNARDWDGVVRHWAPSPRIIDRRSLTGVDLEGDDVLAALRIIYDQPGSRWQQDVLATRGERLALVHWRWLESKNEAVLAEVEYLAVVEVDAAGRQTLSSTFDLDDLDAACAELEARYDAGEAAPYARTRAPLERLNRAVATRNWEELASAFTPDFAIEDHRPLGTLSGLSRDQWVASVRSLAELRPDAALRLDHVLALDDRRALTVGTWVGNEADGAFEITVVVLAEMCPAGIRRWHTYDLDRLHEARARYDALAVSTPRDPLAALAKPNAATAAVDRFFAAFEARDWDAVRSLAAEGATFEDRRGHALESGDIDWVVANLKLEVFDSGLGHFQRSLVAKAGDRVCLHRTLWSGGPTGGPFEIEYLALTEVDESGRFLASVMFDVGDRRAAIREGQRRWLARDPTAAATVRPAVELINAFSDHDRARMRAVLADDVVVVDHRSTGQGRVDGADAYLDTVSVLWGLVTDLQSEGRFALVLESHGVVAALYNHGTLAEGGAFERYEIGLATVERGRITHFELFEVEALDAALARLAELRPDPLRIPPNAATRALERLEASFEARDWPELRALAAPDFRFDDRGRRALVGGDVETWIRNMQVVRDWPGLRQERKLLATAGERLALDHMLNVTDSGEGELLRLVEVAADGRLRGLVRFDPDELRAAFLELAERHARSEEGRALPEPFHELRLALLDWDLERARAAFPPDFAVDDHRRNRLWQIEGRDAWVAWLATLLEQSPDAIMAARCYLAVEPHGCLLLGYSGGTLAEGGAFEQEFLSLWRFRGGRLAGLEMFEPEDLERARARFEELCPAQRE